MYGYGIGYDCYWFRGKWHSYHEKFVTFKQFRVAVEYGWTPNTRTINVPG